MNKSASTPKSESKPKPSHNPTMSINNRVEIIDLTDDDTDLQEAIKASLLLQTGRAQQKRTIIDLDANDENDELQPLQYSLASRKKTRFEIGESSGSKSSPSTTTITFVCEICIETKPNSESFTVMGCTHSYCSDCMVKYVRSKLDQNITRISCPVSDCSKGALDPEHCRPILPPEVFDKWGSALCESVFIASEKFYCPFKDCSALMIDDGGGAIAEAECPNCNRLFCARCKVPWHPGIECSEYQKLDEDERGREDIMLMNLAEDRMWARCPSCKIFVEKTMGCSTMVCRCGCRFIYNPITNLINPGLRSSGHWRHLITRNGILIRTNGYLNPTNPFGTTNGYLKSNQPVGDNQWLLESNQPVGEDVYPIL
ncbi:E3 ubiquitin-protein ligase RSL1-like [Rhododendron vialii]|uniref:E3 ubiquitin-protein ligase RSL1-like n=1 Tax=Rhododendron vialii TaxID=182163 RepID=UPI00265D9C98|nr:E3 ubiquitin-protein ligase RSL1-like [Rhododendron vialii]